MRFGSNYVADFCQVFFFVVKIENLHEVISFYQLLRLKLTSSFDIWISQFETLKMQPFHFLVAAYYNQTVFYQFLPLCCRLALCHFTGFYTYATMQKITTAKMWAKKQKKGNHMPLPALRPCFPGLKIATSTILVSFLLYSKSANKFCSTNLLSLDFKNRKCIPK